MSETHGNLANETCGWASVVATFQSASIDEIVGSLTAYVSDATPEQIRAWKSSIPKLQQGCRSLSAENPKSIHYGAILEFRMPDGPHRVDAIVLVAGAVLVLELKGDGNWQPTYIEQAADYARRLYWFHSLCGEGNVKVHTILCSYGLKGAELRAEFYTLTNIESLRDVVRRFDRPDTHTAIPLERFIEPSLCQPSLSLVQAARRFFADHSLPNIKRIDAVTSGAVQTLSAQIRRTYERKGRLLILLSGVPGAGKTFVGLKIAHESFLDDLATPSIEGAKPTVPAVFLSGNGPLVEVLQYELKRAGGAGRVFVRGIKEFVERYSRKKSPVPPHHVLIFDEAQRAWDEKRVREKHNDPHATSEPAAFIRFAERIPDWGVVIGLIGEGQEIHTGEEGGVQLWADAIRQGSGSWHVVGPDRFEQVFEKSGVRYEPISALHLSRSVRFNFAEGLSEWAELLISDSSPVALLAANAAELRRQGYQLRVTRNVATAKEFLWAKYRTRPEARFGMMISSRDKELKDFGIEARSGAFFRAGPWYADPEDSPSSCRRLQEAITEFAAQGLELDHSLLVWGSDFVRAGPDWSIASAKKYRGQGVRDPMQLRRNAYRVLLTRGREGLLICVPHGLSAANQTFDHLVSVGCEVLA